MILAANFKFDKMPLAEVPNHPPYKYVRAGASELAAHFGVDFLARRVGGDGGPRRRRPAERSGLH